MNRALGIAMAAAIVLATVYAYNRFSGKNIAQLGAGASGAAA